MLPTLDEFLAWKWPSNSYINYPGFVRDGHADGCGIYIRKGDIFVRYGGISARCTNVIQIASVEAAEPGKGSFKALVKDLVERGFAIYVENVLSPKFAEGLPKMGFIRVNPPDICFLGFFDGHLINSRPIRDVNYVL